MGIQDVLVPKSELHSQAVLLQEKLKIPFSMTFYYWLENQYLVCLWL